MTLIGLFDALVLTAWAPVSDLLVAAAKAQSLACEVATVETAEEREERILRVLMAHWF